MKKLIIASILSSVIIMPTAASSDHNHSGMGNGMNSGMMNMMSHEQMMSMHEHMKDMQSTMKKIQSEKDPKKRQALMDKHMSSMQTGMHMMNKGMMNKGMMNKSDKKMDNSEMMKNMGTRMDMMQMMMGQMAEHMKMQEMHNH